MLLLLIYPSIYVLHSSSPWGRPQRKEKQVHKQASSTAPDDIRGKYGRWCAGDTSYRHTCTRHTCLHSPSACPRMAETAFLKRSARMHLLPKHLQAPARPRRPRSTTIVRNALSLSPGGWLVQRPCPGDLKNERQHTRGSLSLPSIWNPAIHSHL